MELVRYIFIMSEVNSFLSQKSLLRCFGTVYWIPKTKKGTHDDPNVLKFMKNTQGLRVVNSIVKPPKSGNCHGCNKMQTSLLVKKIVYHYQNMPTRQ